VVNTFAPELLVVDDFSSALVETVLALWARIF
jgi:hypothetical protein